MHNSNVWNNLEQQLFTFTIDLRKRKTEQSIPRLKFPEEFSLSASPTYYSNLMKYIRLIDEVIAPYLKNEKQKLNLSEIQKGLVNMDIFTDQMRDDVHAALNKNCICAVNVPSNMTRFYQALDLTVNGHANKFMKNRFNIWYISQITKQLDERMKLDQLNVRILLSTITPLHAEWVVELYNHMTSVKGKHKIASGWKAAEITDAINLGTKNLPLNNPFQKKKPTFFKAFATYQKKRRKLVTRLIKC